MKFAQIVSAGLIATAALAATSANAAFVTGNVGIAGVFGSLPNLPTSIVSTLTTMDISLASVGAAGGDGDFSSLAGFSAATAFDFTVGVAPIDPMFTAGGFTFKLTDFVSNGSNAMSCTGRQCADGRDFVGVGIVTGNGFDATPFTITWTAAGTCNNNNGQCTNATGLSSASWTAQISANGAPVPEPGSMALVGLAMAGLALARKSKKA